MLIFVDRGIDLAARALINIVSVDEGWKTGDEEPQEVQRLRDYPVLSRLAEKWRATASPRYQHRTMDWKDFAPQSALAL